MADPDLRVTIIVHYEEKHCFVAVSASASRGWWWLMYFYGSRLTLAVMGLELLLADRAGYRSREEETVITIVPAGLFDSAFLHFYSPPPPDIIYSVAASTVVDEMFGTSYAIRYGVDSLPR